MQVRCPHCHNAIDMVNDDPSGDVSCPSCGSCFNLVKDGETLTADGPQAKMLGHFQLLHCLGQGAFGVVWKARDTKLDRLVAIKIPRKENLTEADAEKFLREARAAAQVRHPNIVSVHEVGREDGHIYIASDYIDGPSLDQWIDAHPLTARESAELCAKIAEALHHAHEAGIVHRDLKPQNILVRAEGQGARGEGKIETSSSSSLAPHPSSLAPFITDFGLAKREAGEVTMTIEGQVLGTPAYMPPEQARGEGHQADRRSDVYSLGVILFRLLTGELPFRGKSQMLLDQILKEEPPRPRSLDARIPRDVETICLKCLEKEPARRYQTSAELAADLRRWLTGHPIQARPVSRPERAWRWCRRNPAVASLSLAVVAVLLMGIAVSSYFASDAAARAKQFLGQKIRADQKAKDADEQRRLAVAAQKDAEAAKVRIEDQQREIAKQIELLGLEEGLRRLVQDKQTLWRIANKRIEPLHKRLTVPDTDASMQTFASFLQTQRSQFTAESRIDLQSVGPMDHPEVVENVAEFLRRFYGIPVRILPPKEQLTLAADAQRERSGHQQWLAGAVISAMRSTNRKPANDFGNISNNARDSEIRAALSEDQQPNSFLLIITEKDLWSGELNYVFGTNNVKLHTAIMSLSRYQPPSPSPDGNMIVLRRAIKVAVFLAGQNAGIRDFAGYRCCMNRTNSVKELDLSPLAFCPECERKVWWLADSDPLQRYELLKDFAQSHNLREDQTHWEKAITAIRTGTERP